MGAKLSQVFIIHYLLHPSKLIITTSNIFCISALLGMTSIISIICHYIGKLFQAFLMSEEDEDKSSIGTVSAILFYILSLQTGLTNLQPDKRFIRLCRNMCLLLTALLHFLHNMVSPILMSLSASHNPSRKRHSRYFSHEVLQLKIFNTNVYLSYLGHCQFACSCCRLPLVYSLPSGVDTLHQPGSQP